MTFWTFLKNLEIVWPELYNKSFISVPSLSVFRQANEENFCAKAASLFCIRHKYLNYINLDAKKFTMEIKK